MVLLTVGGWIALAAVLVLSHAGPRAAPAAIRPEIRWIWAGLVLANADATLMMIIGNGDRVAHRAGAAGGLVLITAGFVCLGVGLFKMRRRRQAAQAQSLPRT